MLYQVLGCVSLGTICLFGLFSFSDDTSALTYNRLIGNVQGKHLRPLRKGQIIIYAATKYFGKDLSTTAKIYSKNCPREVQEYCTVSSDDNDIPDADAILYHNRDFKYKNYVDDPTKIQIMFTSESQENERIRFKPGTINWTQTFKRDSEIFAPYGGLQLLPEEKNVDLESIWTMKDDNLTTAWLASNCKTANHRTELIKNAKSKGLQLDIYGGCGRQIPECERYSKDYFNCAADILGKYKFYFAFENSNCVDYVTEKFWNSLEQFKAVPIVIQRNLLTDLGIPGDSFIALDDFSSMQEMVDFLSKLKNDKKRYLSYHEWRKYYKVSLENMFGFCNLCKRLKEGNQKPHVYEDLAEWFSPKTQCNNSYAKRYLH